MNTAVSIYNKHYKIIIWIMLFLCILMIFPIAYTIGDEIGGYTSEKIISRTGQAASDLAIGGSTNSIYDIGFGEIYIEESSPTYQITNLIPLFMMALLLYMIIKAMTTGDYSKGGILILIYVILLIYIFYAFLPGIRETITNLLGGGY